MRKEQLIAIFLGSLIGVSAAFGLWRISRSNSRDSSPTTAATNSTLETENTQAISNEFSIVSPQNNAVVGADSAAIQGFASPNSVIAALAEEITISAASASGEFSVNSELASGVNKVAVLSFSKGNTPEKKELTLISTTRLDLSDPKKTATATFGTVTDITADTLQIRTESGQIELASMSTETTFASTLDTPREIEFSDLAIGDSVAALGFINDDKIMEAGRVLVISAPKANSYEAVVGIIQTLSSREFIVKTHGDEKEVSIDATGGVTVQTLKDGELTATRLATAEDGGEIIIIGTYEDDELVAENIILL